MKVTIFEVCRRPEVPKQDTEGQVLRAALARLGIAHDLHSNDGIWAGVPGVARRPGIAAVARAAADPHVGVLHFATHGTAEGLVMAWSGPIDARVPRVLLTPAKVRRTLRLAGRLVVSGACQSAHMADDFLHSGARGVIAPEREIPWARLGAFFTALYRNLASGQPPAAALAQARGGFAELASYRHFGIAG
jgi:hypothetical protein